jgi:hypothetical protein
LLLLRKPSSKFEILRLLYVIGDFKSFDSQVKKWGGKENLLKEAKERFLPKPLYSILETEFIEPKNDPDSHSFTITKIQVKTSY